MAGRYFGIPFATSGDKVAVPDATQPDGSVSFTQGFGIDYERANTDPDYKPVPRDGTNGLFHDITEALGIVQKQGVADWTASAQPYPINALVRHNNVVWRSLVGTNNVEPVEGPSWTAISNSGISQWDSGTSYINPVLVYGPDTRLYISQQNSTNQNPITDDGTNWRVLDNSFSYEFFHAQDQKTSGTSAGGSTAGTWQTRTLNTELTNTIGSASLASNQITLPAGRYYIEASAPAYNVDGHKTRFQNITDATTVLSGTGSRASTGAAAMNRSFVYGFLEIAATKVFELQHKTQQTQATNGLGLGYNSGDIEVYADVQIWKVQ